MTKTERDYRIDNYEFLIKRAKNSIKIHKNKIKKLKKKYTPKQFKFVVNDDRLLINSPGRYLAALKSYIAYDEERVKEYKKFIAILKNTVY